MNREIHGGEGLFYPHAVLFDLDGVLIDTFAVWENVLEQCRASRGLEPLGRARIEAGWGQGIDQDCRLFFPGTTVDELAQEFDEHFVEHLDQVRLVTGAEQLVDRISRLGLKRAVVTNTPRKLAQRLVQQVGLFDRLPVVCGADEVSAGKPDPALIHLATQRLGSAPHAVWMIGDTSLDVQAARAAGALPIGLNIEADVTLQCLNQLVEWLDEAIESPEAFPSHHESADS